MGQDIHAWVHYDKVDYPVCAVQVHIPRDYDLFELLKTNRGIPEPVSHWIPTEHPDYHGWSWVTLNELEDIATAYIQGRYPGSDASDIFHLPKGYPDTHVAAIGAELERYYSTLIALGICVSVMIYLDAAGFTPRLVYAFDN